MLVKRMMVLVAIALTSTFWHQGALAYESHSFSLDNGLQVVVLPDHRAPVATHMIWYKVGAADEAPGKAGIAHFLEHLMFKGTTRFPGRTFSDKVAAIGGQENAFTSSDYTAYFQRIAKDHLGMVMEMEADRMTNLILTEDDVSVERDVVMEERRSRVDNDPSTQLGEALDAALYPEHPYGRPIIGWEHEIVALNRDDALDVYRQFYTPSNAILIVAGDVDVDEVRRLAEQTYGKIEGRGAMPPRLRQRDPAIKASRQVTLRDARVEQESLRRQYIVPSYATAKPGEAEALDVLSEILAGGATGRLYERLVVERKIATAAGGFYRGAALNDGAFYLFAVPAEGVSLNDLEAALDEELAAAIADAITPEQVARAQKNILSEAIYARDSQSTMARIYGIALTTGSTIEDVEAWPQRIEAVTVEAVKAAALAHLNIEGSATAFLMKRVKQQDPS